jgi:hypothetical protein
MSPQLRALLNSALDVSNQIYHMIGWAGDKGLNVSAAIHVANYNEQGMGLGLCARAAVQQSTTILRFPTTFAMSSQDQVPHPSPKSRAT